MIVLSVKNVKNLKSLKYHISYICDKTLLLFSICNKWGSADKKIFKGEKSIEILRLFSLINKIKSNKWMKTNISQEFELKI